MKTETINAINTKLHANITAQLELLDSKVISEGWSLKEKQHHLVHEILPALAKYPLEACNKQGCRRTIDDNYLSHPEGWKPLTAGWIEMTESVAELNAIIEMRKADLFVVLGLFPLRFINEPMFTPALDLTQVNPDAAFWDDLNSALRRLHALGRNYTLDQITSQETRRPKIAGTLSQDTLARITSKLYALSESAECEPAPCEPAPCRSDLHESSEREYAFDISSIVGETVRQYIIDLYSGSVKAGTENHWLNLPNANLYAGYLRTFIIELITSLYIDVHKDIPEEPEQFSVGVFTLLITLAPRNKLESIFERAVTMSGHIELMELKAWLTGLTPTIK